MKIHASNTQKLCEIFQDECNALGEKKKDQREDYRLQTDRRDMLYCDAESDNPNHKLILFLEVDISEVDIENMNDVIEENNDSDNDSETEGETKAASTSNSKFNKTDREFQERKTKVLGLRERSREATELLNMFQEDCLLPNGLNYDNTIRILPAVAGVIAAEATTGTAAEKAKAAATAAIDNGGSSSDAAAAAGKAAAKATTGTAEEKAKAAAAAATDNGGSSSDAAAAAGAAAAEATTGTSAAKATTIGTAAEKAAEKAKAAATKAKAAATAAINNGGSNSDAAAAAGKAAAKATLGTAEKKAKAAVTAVTANGGSSSDAAAAAGAAAAEATDGTAAERAEAAATAVTANEGTVEQHELAQVEYNRAAAAAIYSQNRKHINLMTEKEIRDKENLKKGKKLQDDQKQKSWSSTFRNIFAKNKSMFFADSGIGEQQSISKFLNDKHYGAVKHKVKQRDKHAKKLIQSKRSIEEKNKEIDCSCIQCHQKKMELRVETAKFQVKEATRKLLISQKKTNKIKYMSDFQVKKAKQDADRKVELCKDNLSQTSSRLITFTEKRERAQAEVRMHQETYVFEPTMGDETAKSLFANALEQYYEDEVLLNPSGETKSNTVLPGENQDFNLTRHVSDQRKKELAIEMNYLKCTSDGSCTQDQLLGFFDQFSSLGEHRIALQVLYDALKQHANKNTTSPECCLLDPENCVCFTGKNNVYSFVECCLCGHVSFYKNNSNKCCYSIY